MATTPLQAERVELDRQAVLDLLREAGTLVAVIETLVGSSPTQLTAKLTTQIEIVAEQLVGEWSWDAATRGAREKLDDASVEGAKARFRELAEKAVRDAG